MKASVLVPILFVAVYLILSALFLSVFGAAGHGWGIAAFYYLGFPLSYVSDLVEDATNSGELAAATCLLAGILQSALIGYGLARLFGRSRVVKSP